MIRQRCAQRRTRLEIPSLAEDPESDPRMVGEAEDTPQRLQFGQGQRGCETMFPRLYASPITFALRIRSAQGKQSPDSGREPFRPSIFMLLHVVTAVEQRAVSQLSARQALAQLFDHAGAGLEERRECVLGYFVDHNPRERGDPGRQRLTG
jgi:hypothetical protein